MTPRLQYPPDVIRGIHTMANDLMGDSRPEPTQEALVTFEPAVAVTQGAPFYADPDVMTSLEETIPTVAQSGASPFLSNSTEPPQKPVATAPPNLPVETETVLEIAPPSPQRETDRSPTSAPQPSQGPVVYRESWFSRFRIWILAGCVVIGLAGGAIWWWTHRAADTAPTTGTGPVTDPLPAPLPTPTTTITSEHYTTAQPNLLSLDTETVTAEGIKTEFLKIALSIKQDNLQGPVEFLVRDQKYNPLAFSRFAYLLGLKLSPDMLTALDEDFSLYFFVDGDRTRMGIKIKIKNGRSFSVALARDEKLLPKVLEPLYLDTTTAPKTGLTFRSSRYHEQPLRYVNIDRELNLSVDMAIRGTEWLVGTSQNTLRAMLDQSKSP